jgi:hypothetical protein
MTRLAVAPPATAASSINLGRATPVIPIAIRRPSSPPCRPILKEVVNARRQQTADAEIPIAPDALLRHTSRGFLPWRFADAGPGVRRTTFMGPPSENLHKSRPQPANDSTSVLPLEADIHQGNGYFSFVPRTDSCIATNSRKFIGANLISSATGRRWFEIGCQACSSSSNALASFRSSVSKPSVNQP